ncbi:hypothetical protein XELAEV_18011149mg [Xenopus laevis]|uniref:Uncharacterized protein n=1 Tax=Xenopus laevis TaxID=8355 RepID=A0A974DW50_XENLA|nr:hypothetical protein XELAEV_18011149mg [Xenopus laevis]
MALSLYNVSEEKLRVPEEETHHTIKSVCNLENKPICLLTSLNAPNVHVTNEQLWRIMSMFSRYRQCISSC